MTYDDNLAKYSTSIYILNIVF